MPKEYFLAHLWLVPLFPLAGAAIMLFFGRHLPKAAVNLFCVGGVFMSGVYACGAIFQLLARPESNRVVEYVLFDWLPAGAMHTTAGHLAYFDAAWGYLFDPLTVVMLGVVTGVGFLIHLYSVGYMAHEGGYYRFFGYLNLFMFSMLTLVLANNILEMFVGWEGVGLCSYLLIGFYFHKKSATDAGKKAFIVNRIGDAGFILGVFLMAGTFGTINFTALHHAILVMHLHKGDAALTVIALLLFVGATGKSAQLPLYVWLPDAMEGPTPVSALIHAATMVTAGVYMVVRTSAIFTMAPAALAVMAVVGATTAIFAATIGICQTDIKKVLAYSTISQLGYMFLACGVGAFSAGVFHLMTHAFFKGLLFLAAGSVIHVMSGEQDMLKMGALSKKIPITYRTMLVATLAISGIPPLAGFFSKDEILGHAFVVNPILWFVGWITAGITSFYMFRLLFLTFHGTSRVPHEAEHHIHESPWTMTLPLIILALLSIVGGWVGIGGRFENFLAPVENPREVPYLVTGSEAELGGAQANMGVEATEVTPGTPAQRKEEEKTVPEGKIIVLSVLVALAGIWFAYYLYLKRTDLPAKIAASAGGLYTLVYEKYYVDQIYDAMFVNRIKDLGLALGAFDRIFVDGLFINGAGRLTRVVSVISAWWDKWFVDGLLNLGARIFWLISYPMRMLQTGRVGSYALLIVVGLLVFFGFYMHAAGYTMANLWH